MWVGHKAEMDQRRKKEKKIETFLAVDFFLTPPVQTRSTNERHENSASQLKFNPKRTHELQFCTFDLFDMIPVTNNKEKQPWAHRNRDLLTTHSIIEPLNRTLKLSEY